MVKLKKNLLLVAISTTLFAFSIVKQRRRKNKKQQPLYATNRGLNIL